MFLKVEGFLLGLDLIVCHDAGVTVGTGFLGSQIIWAVVGVEDDAVEGLLAFWRVEGEIGCSEDFRMVVGILFFLEEFVLVFLF